MKMLPCAFIPVELHRSEISDLFILKNLYLEAVFLLGKTCFMGLTESVAQALMASRESTAPVSLLNHCELKLEVV